MDEQSLKWVPAYEAIASALLDYEDKQEELANLIGEILNEDFSQMDPLTFFSAFNGKRARFDARAEMVARIVEFLELDVETPQKFDAIPVTNPQRWRFWDGKPNTIEHNWAFFKAALAYADSPTDASRDEFTQLFDIVRAQGNVGDGNLTMALFWVRPSTYLPLDGNTRRYLGNRFDIAVPYPLDGNAYLSVIENLRSVSSDAFTTISYAAWELSGWVPAPSVYNPGVTAEQWTELLGDPSVGTSNALTALKCFAEHPKGATCAELDDDYGRGASFYNNAITTLGQKVAERLSVPVRDIKNGKYWPIACVGNYVGKRRHGTFEWRLRPELLEALGTLDLGDVSLRPVEFDLSKLRKLIDLYKQDFYRFRGPDAPHGDQESYKWDDLIAFQRNWDIDAEDFGASFKAAFKPAASGQGVLLGNGWQYPYRRLVKLVEFDQEAVRGAFKELYGATGSLRDTYLAFADRIDEVLRDYNDANADQLDGSHQTQSAVSLYLTYGYPERFHFYKPEVAADFAKSIGASFPSDPTAKLVQYQKLCDQVLPFVLADEGLVAMSDGVLTQEQIEADPAHHWLLQDIAYYISRYMPTWHPDWESLLEFEENAVDTANAPVYPKNLILYGPPGTGKTYQTKAYAVAICDGRDVEDVLAEMDDPAGYEKVSMRYRELRDQKRIGFTTFHQSYGYEEFIEGMRPEFDEATGVVSYPVKAGAFREFCENADDVVATVSAKSGIPSFPDNPRPRVWKMGLSTNGNPELIEPCRKEGCVRLGWDEVPPEAVAESTTISEMNRRVLLSFQETMQPGDVVVVPGVSTDEYGVAVITGEFEWHPELKDDKRYRKAQWLNNVSKAKFIELNGGKRLTLQTIYELSRINLPDLLELMGLVTEEAEKEDKKAKPYVFIIDEINRGDVSKVFGELITLLEPNKRKGEKEQITVTLPYSGLKFSVPSNVYVLGTMNTADRSIALMDTALRRRFDFAEVMPNPELLGDLEVEGVDIAAMLGIMNKRIELLYDREHTLGHAYFMPLRENPTIKVLASIFKSKIIPLLQEYFFDDYAKIGSVLGAAARDFIEPIEANRVFWSGDEEPYDQLRAFKLKGVPENAEAYQRIYEME